MKRPGVGIEYSQFCSAWGEEDEAVLAFRRILVLVAPLSGTGRSDLLN